jgi:hypothetical protein
MMKYSNMLGLVFGATALAAMPAPAKPPAGQKPVMRVEAGSVTFLRVPGMVLICARGQVGSPGWTNATLTPRVIPARPAGGIWAVDFTAKPPSGIVPQVVTPINAERRWAAPARLKAVRIISRTNSIVVRVPSERSAC